MGLSVICSRGMKLIGTALSIADKSLLIPRVRRLAKKIRDIPLVVSINPGLVGDFAHYKAYDKALRTELVGRGGDMLTLCDIRYRKSGGGDGINAVRTFDCSTWILNQRTSGSKSARREFCRRLRAAHSLVEEAVDGNAEVVYFMYSSSLVIAADLSTMGSLWRERPCYANLLYETPSEWDEGTLLRIIDEQKAEEGGIRLCCEVPRKRERLARMAGPQVRGLPIFPLNRRLQRRSLRSPEFPLRITCPSNYMHPSKGYMVAIEFGLWLHEKSGGAFRMKMRFCPRRNTAVEYFRAVEKSKGAVDFVAGDMDEEEYCEFIMNSDVLYIPYDPSVFDERTSSTFTEAVQAGIPVIVSPGTWMADELGEGRFGVAVDTDDFDRTYSALEEIRKDYPRWAAEADGGRDEWLKYHHVRHVADRILGG